MSVLKSFELKGNKQSFANWISSLSPSETPFTSMIGKEGIDQTQYSWQTDALSAPSATVYEEGSIVEPQLRTVTHELTNFTSILRKVVKLSDTNEATHAWGRNNEMAYQMSKAGKEILRDLEYMNLHNKKGNIGTKAIAGKFSGFEGLTADLGEVCLDTGAVVHKEITVAGGVFTAIDKDDLFDMTYNLYLSGSKANKIMYHPKHAQAFSALVSNNTKEPLTYRMFKNLDDKYNAKVAKIRDPLCREYTLISNRYMPENKIYFFNENDWQQMVLRAPYITKLAKNGSNETKMIEMEVGLRHKHPFASGILTLNTVTLTNSTFASKDTMTAGVGDSSLVTADIEVNGVGEEGLLVSWHSSNVNIVDFQHPTQLTNDQGRAVNYLRGGSEAGVARIWSICRGVKSEEYTVTCRNPVVELTVDDAAPNAGEDILFTATVKKVDGTDVGSDILVKWHHNPDFNLAFTEESTKTDNLGVASVTAQAINTNPTIVQAVVNGVPSDQLIINYIPTSDVVESPVITPNTFKSGETVTANIDVIDHEGNPLSGAMVHWNYHPYGLVSLSSTESITDINGTATITLTGVNTGTGFLSGTCEGVTSEATSFYVNTGGNLTLEISPNPVTVGDLVEVTATLTGVDGSPLRDTTVWFETDPPLSGLRQDETDIQGKVEESFTPLVPGDYDITAVVDDFRLRQTVTLSIVN